MIHQIAKKHSKASAIVVHKGKICEKDFHSFYNLQEHNRTEHWAQRGLGAQNDNVTQLIGVVGEKSLNEELETCKHFLVDSEMDNGRLRVYNFAMDTLDPKNLLEKLVVAFDRLKGAAKLNVSFSFVFKHVGEGSCRYY